MKTVLENKGIKTDTYYIPSLARASRSLTQSNMHERVRKTIPDYDAG